MLLIFLVPPIVAINPSRSPLTVFVNATLRLFCTAKGQPFPDVLWYEGNTPIIQPLPQLYLVPTKSPHTTNYTCVATNNAGGKKHQTSVSIIVIVRGIQHIIMHEILTVVYIKFMVNSKNSPAIKSVQPPRSPL